MNIDFESYIRGIEPEKKEKASAWKTAIGLQAVDGLQTSDYLKDTPVKHIEGDISMDEVKKFINGYYRSKTARTPEDEETEEPGMSFLVLFFRNLMMGEKHDLKGGFVAPLYPNSPKHPKQKYLLTMKGLVTFYSLL